MEHSRARRHVAMGYSPRGRSRADVVVVLVFLGVLLLALSVLLPAFRMQQRTAYRLQCDSHLMDIGKAMMVYANDYDGVLPVAGGQGMVWGAGLDNWKGENVAAAFGFEASGIGGKATVSSSLYLLVKYGGVLPELFVCGKDKATTVFRSEEYEITGERLTSVWDFGPNPARHCSYSYHMPYSQHGLTASTGPGVAVAADRNPWIDGPRQKGGDFSLFKPDLAPFKGKSEEARQGNSQTHRTKISHQDGQNVLYLDGHVWFATRAFCGYEDDNIYTSWDGDDKMRGIAPRPYESKPAHEFDSLLVNDPPLGR